jgi:DNA-binding MarR family transcriptional regulator
MAAGKRPADDNLADPLDAFLGYQLRRASNSAIASLAEALSAHGLSVVEASVLTVIAENNGATQSAIGRLLDIQRANMAPIASKLARMGLTKSEPHGRQLLLRTSALGTRTAQKVKRCMVEHDASTFPRIKPADRKKLQALLRSIWRDEEAPS